MVHIVSSERTKEQIEVMNEVTKGVGVIDLFGIETSFTSRKKYD
jgi:hypothetical protein